SAGRPSRAAWLPSASTAGPGRRRASRPSTRFCGSPRKTRSAMPVFAYRAADRRGQTVDGVMEAPDARAVIERLHREAYFPVKVSPQGERRAWLDVGFSRGMRARDLLAFTQQLATLAEAGMPLDRALAILEELAPNARVKAVVVDLLRGVRGGSSLSD